MERVLACIAGGVEAALLSAGNLLVAYQRRTDGNASHSGIDQT